MDNQTNHNYYSDMDVHTGNSPNHRYKGLGIMEDNINIINNYDIDSQQKNTFDTKIQELIDNPKILNTLRSIKSNNSINYEEIKNLPGLFLDIQEALKKSNTNVLELKETINEQIQKEAKLKNKLKELLKENESLKGSIANLQNNEMEMKNKIDHLKIENMTTNQNVAILNDVQKKYENVLKENKSLKKENENTERKRERLKEEIESKEKTIEELNDHILELKKSYNELHLKNKKYKTNQDLLKDEISNIEEKLDEIKVFKQEIKNLQSETNTLRTQIKELEEERRVYITKEARFKEEIKSLAANNKKIKSDLKNELNEKISILKEMDNLKTNQKNFHEKHENLRNIIENTTVETERMSNKLKAMTAEKEELENKLNYMSEELCTFEDVKLKYQELFNDFNSIVEENNQLREELSQKKFSEQEVYKLSDKYEEEIFNLKCYLNLWKNAFIEIAKYKLINYDDSNSEDLTGLDKNYIYNAPVEMRSKCEGVVTYFKSLIEEENYQTVNLKSLKEALVNEQERNNYMKQQLQNEMHLRRKIHNRYMLVRGNLRVMCRIRPFLESELASLTKKAFLDTFSLSPDSISINENGRKKNFEFDYIFGQKSHQHEVYDEVSLLVQSMMQGNNICIVAYGQTCTGKTYTIQGPNKSHPGVAVRAAKELFEIIGEELSKNTKNKNGSKLSLSIIEIYNENIYNLLAEGQPMLNIYENSSSNLVIPELNPIKISNFNEAGKLFTLASKLRHTNQTSYNDRSSRSHCIYSFHLKLVSQDGSKVTRSKLHIIDLAGSERLSKSHSLEDEVTKKEAISINLSLHALANVLNALAIKQNHVPYRDSKLTHFLKESLNENFNILLLLHISPNIRDIGETISTLEFGTRIVKICKHKTGKEKMVMIGNNYSNSNSINK